MKKVKITILKTMLNEDLTKEYGICGLKACPMMKVGDVRFGQSDDYRRAELISIIEHSVENLTLQELEALYYDMSTKNYINN